VGDYSDLDPSEIEWTRAFLAFGAFLQAPILDSTEAEISDQIRVNLTSQILVVRRLLGTLSRVESRRRDIVLVGSTSAYTGFGGSSVYCASKFGLRGFVEAMNAEWSSSNVRFWLASMGSMDNAMGRRVPNVKQDHLLSPLEVARDIVRVVVRETSAFQPEIIIRRRWIP
jgi:NAD(P)-dependent dehydrogenase (short-subunit alcohol dehydrogenase family)